MSDTTQAGLAYTLLAFLGVTLIVVGHLYPKAIVLVAAGYMFLTLNAVLQGEAEPYRRDNAVRTLD